MPRKKTPDGMVLISVLIPRNLRGDLEQLRQQTGLSISQQARTSLTLWVMKCQKATGSAQKMYAKGFDGLAGPSDGPGQGLTPPAKVKPFEPGPEPDQKADPVAWAKWSAKAGNAAIAKLAAGEWPDD